MQQPIVDLLSDLSFVYFWVCVKVIQGTEKLKKHKEHPGALHVFSEPVSSWLIMWTSRIWTSSRVLDPFMWNELGEPHMHLTPFIHMLSKAPRFSAIYFSLTIYNKWKRTWNRPVCLYTWNSNMCSYIVGYTFTYFSAGVVVSIAGVLMFIITALIVVSCVVMKRKQAFNINKWVD